MKPFTIWGQPFQPRRSFGSNIGDPIDIGIAALLPRHRRSAQLSLVNSAFEPWSLLPSRWYSHPRRWFCLYLPEKSRTCRLSHAFFVLTGSPRSTIMNIDVISLLCNGCSSHGCPYHQLESHTCNPEASPTTTSFDPNVDCFIDWARLKEQRGEQKLPKDWLIEQMIPTTDIWIQKYVVSIIYWLDIGYYWFIMVSRGNRWLTMVSNHYD